MKQPMMPPLDTERLVLRPFVDGDLDDVYHILDCDCFGQRSPDDEQAKQHRRAWLEWNIAGQQQQASLGHPPYGDRAITRKSDGRIVGICGLVPSMGPFRRVIDGVENCTVNSPEIGLFYAVASDQRRQGYATEATSALVRFAFETLKAARVVATTEKDNAASIAVMRQLNFTIRRNTRGWPDVIGFLTASRRPDATTRTNGRIPLSCQQAIATDVPLLARMNKQLIEDEASRNPMSLSELEDRMAGWIAGGWQAHVIKRDSDPIGYILFQFRSDEYRPSQKAVYLRQFFIEREYRSQGIGRRAFEIVSEACFADVSTIVLDVLETNPRARRFWESLGFHPYCTSMIRESTSGGVRT